MTKSIAAIQMVTGKNIEQNLLTAAKLLAEAAQAGASLAVLPEMFALMHSPSQRALGEREAAQSLVRKFLRAQAKEHGLWIVGGTLPLAVEADEKRVLAACYLVDADGEEVVRYDKIHLFDVAINDKHGSYCESSTFIPGQLRSVVVNTPVGRLGLAVCYDIRFAELFVSLAAQKADIIAVPAAFTRVTGEAHWLPLLKARAIETQCYIVGANQGGQHGRTRQTSGGSVIIDPWGRVLVEAGRGERVICANRDVTFQEKLRSGMPISEHRRFTVSQ